MTFGKNIEGMITIELSPVESEAFLDGKNVIKHSEDAVSRFTVEVKLTRVSQLTLKEKGVLLHTLGGGRRNQVVRNHFVTGAGSDDFPVLEELVKKGLMKKAPYKLNDLAVEFVYSATEAGAAAVKCKLPPVGEGGG